MKRRQFLKGAATAGVVTAAASSLPSPAISQGKQEWKMALTWPANTPGLGMNAQNVARRVELFTEGRIKIRVYGAGELVPAFQAFDATAAGDVEMYQGAEYYWQGKHKAFNFFTTVPYGFTATEQYGWIKYGGGQQLWDELGAEFGVKGFMGVSTGTQMLGWFNKEMNTVDDFRGLRFRIPGIAGEVYRRIGAAVVNLPAAEIFPAMQAGTVDAVEWVGPWADTIFGLHRIAKYFYYPGVHEPGTAGSFGINRKIWDGLSKTDQEMLTAVIEAEALIGTAEYRWRNPAALRDMVQKHKIQVRKLSDEVLTEIGKASGRVVAEMAAENPLTKRVYESFLAGRKAAIDYSQIAEQAYYSARILPFDYT
jgi:TRAP-type mannitol/chloroaromatic compound transport system substrate-binding protein